MVSLACICYWKSFQCQRNLCAISSKGTYIQSFTPKESEGLAFNTSEIITQLLSPQLNYPTFTSLNLVLSELSFT